MRSRKKETPAQAKMHKVMSEFKEGKLRSGSRAGPKVKDRKQAVAIGMSEADKTKRGKSDMAMLKKKRVPY